MKTLPFCLGLARASEHELVECFESTAQRHEQEYEIRQSCKLFSRWCQNHLAKLDELKTRYGGLRNPDPARMKRALFHGPRLGGFGLMRDLQDLLLLVHQARTAWTALMQAAKEMKDTSMVETCSACAGEIDRQIDWLCTHIKVAAPQALTVPVDLLSEAKGSAMTTRNLVLGGIFVGVAGLLVMNLRE
jgi:ferredoxin-nitrate reductase